MRSARVWAMVLVLGPLGACSDDEAPAKVPADASADGACGPQNMSAWRPTWRPPEPPRPACTDQQLEREFAVCESATASNAECFAWNRDPANAACLQCLYSTEDEPTYGPVVYLKNRSRVVNIPGCIALVEGNSGPTSCGAEVQAYYSCQESACLTTCVAFADFDKCQPVAAATVCAQYGPGAVCDAPSTYDPCTGQDSFDTYFKIFARMFCGMAAPDGGSAPDGGVPRDGGDGGRTPDFNASRELAPRGAGAARAWPLLEQVVSPSPAGDAIGEVLRR